MPPTRFLRARRLAAFLVDELVVLVLAVQAAFVLRLLSEFVWTDSIDRRIYSALYDWKSRCVGFALAIVAWTVARGPRAARPSIGHVVVGLTHRSVPARTPLVSLVRVVPTLVLLFALYTTTSMVVRGYDPQEYAGWAIRLGRFSGLVVLVTTCIDLVLLLLPHEVPTLGERMAALTIARDRDVGPNLSRASTLVSRLVFTGVVLRLIALGMRTLHGDAAMNLPSELADRIDYAAIPAVAIVLARVHRRTDERLDRTPLSPLYAFAAVGLPGLSFFVLRRWVRRLTDALALDPTEANPIIAAVEVGSLLVAVHAGLWALGLLAVARVPLPFDSSALGDLSWFRYVVLVEGAAFAFLLHRLPALRIDTLAARLDPDVAATFA